MRALALWLAAAPALACPLPGAPLAAGPVQLAWRVDGPALAVGRHFTLQIDVCPADARLVRVDATMPEHRHGMNYRPSVTPAGAGRWKAEGLMFHMPGRWELRFDVETAAGAQTLRESVGLR